MGKAPDEHMGKQMTADEFDKLPTPDAKLAAWHQTSAEQKRLTALERHMRNVCFGIYFNHADGTENFELGNGYKLKGVASINYTLDHKPVEGGGDTALEKALDAIDKIGNEGSFIGERLVKWKPELSVSEYKSLAADSPIKKAIDAVLTTKPGSPTLEIIEPKAKV